MNVFRLLFRCWTLLTPLIILIFPLTALSHCAVRMRDLLWKRTWRNAFKFRRESRVIDMGWHSLPATGKATLPFDVIRTRIRSSTGADLLRIEEIPHFPWIRSLIAGREDRQARAVYVEFLKTFRSPPDIEKQIEKVTRLIDAPPDECPLVVHEPQCAVFKPVLFLTVDGVHRAAIARARGATSIDSWVL